MVAVMVGVVVAVAVVVTVVAGYAGTVITVRTMADLERLPPGQREVVRAQIAERYRHPAVRAVRGGVCDLLAWRLGDAYRPVQFHRDLGALCDRLVESARKRTALWACIGVPPGHGKTLHVGVAMGPRLMALEPGARVLYGTSTAELAVDVSRDARDLVVSLYETGMYPHLEPGTPWTVTDWATKGGCRWVGVGEGAATGGRRGWLIIGDDVTGSEARQASPAWRRGARRWWVGDMLSRDIGGAAVALMETRRGLHDMQGWMTTEYPGRCEVHTWPHVSDDGRYLWPERYGADWHANQPQLASTRLWHTQYQQRPTIEGGAVIQEAWLQHRYEGEPAAVRRTCSAVLVCIDPAAKTSERNDPSGILVAGMRGSDLLILHAEAPRLDYPALRRRALDLAREWSADGIYVEDTSTGLAMAPDLRGQGVPCVPVSVAGGGDKVARMTPHLPRLQAGQVLLPRSAPWVRALVDQLVSVPDAEHDDLWDALVIALVRTRGATTSLWMALAGRGT